MAVILAVSACGSTPAASISAKPTVSQPSATAATVPGGNSGGTCNASTIPAFKPDYSKRGPLPGGGATPQDLWTKANALLQFEGNPGKLIYDPKPDYNLGLPIPAIPADIGVICPNGDVFLQGTPVPILRHVLLLNTEPNGGEPVIPGGRLWLHSAADAIGGVPCQALIQIIKPPDLNIRETIAAGLVGVTCTNNGSFRIKPVRGTD